MATIEVCMVHFVAPGEWAAQAATRRATFPCNLTYNRRQARGEVMQDRELAAAWLASELPAPRVPDDRAKVVCLDARSHR